MTEKDLHFAYGFVVAKDIPHFDKYPDRIQASVEASIVDVIYQSFVIPADEDYLVARMLAQKSMYRGFYWSAAQAVEKYLKAFLLFAGHSVVEKRFKGHPLKALLNAVQQIDKTLEDVDLSRSDQVSIEAWAKEHVKNHTLANFIADLETFGSPDNRYNALGVDFDTGHLFALDALISVIRSKLIVPSIDESYRKLDNEMQNYARKYNPKFYEAQNDQESIPNSNFQIKFAGAVTKLEFLIRNKNTHPYGVALQWLDLKMKLPKTTFR